MTTTLERTPRGNPRPVEHTVANGAMAFRTYAACRSHDPEFFFPSSHGGHESAQEKAAKAICRACPALDACGAWVAANPKLTAYGVWAATSERERRRALESAEVVL